MNTQYRSKFEFLMTIGSAFAILASFGTSTVAQANASMTSFNTGSTLDSTSQGAPDAVMKEKPAQFEEYLGEMQQELSIPGMSAAIVKDQELIWAKGFGYADVEAKRLATSDTPYEIASLTKALSSTILLQLVEQGLVNLDDPVSKYGIHIKGPGVIRVRHLLGMTSLGEPGSFFAYSGARYGLLQKVIERASGRSFPSQMIENILTPLEMKDSIPIDMIRQPAYTHILDNLSRPYGMNQTYEVVFSPAGGLVSTVTDLANFDIALDQDQLIDPQTKTLAFTAQTLSSGDPPVYGLGWFVQEFDDAKMVWAFGYNAFSHLYLKFVDQGYTLIILTNNTVFGDHLSARDYNVMRYPAAIEFYKLFIRDMAPDEMIDWDASEEVIAAQLQSAQESGDIEIARQEILDRYLTNWILEKNIAAQQAMATYTHFFASSQPPAFTSQTPFAKIDQVGNNAYAILEFTLEKDTQVAIYAVGEYWLGKMVDYGGIEDVSSGKLIWEMTPSRTSPAGGHAINRQEAAQIDLQPGTYRLHYRTAWGHAYDNWETWPPDDLFWGIALYSSEGEPRVITRTIVPTAKDELLAGLTPLTGKPIISTWENSVLWMCLGILFSALIIIPVLLYRRKRAVEATTKIRRWKRVAGWAAWVNSLLCLVQILMILLVAGSLEYIVEYPLVLVSNSPAIVLVFVGITYACIVLAVIQVVFTALVWIGKQYPLVERIYYSLVTLAAAGYLLLWGSWGLIAALY